MDTSAKIGSGDPSVERTSRRMHTLEEKLAIIRKPADRTSRSRRWREHGINANQVFGWMRLHRRGLLASQRHGNPVPLLPVKITTPTLTPTERSAPSAQSNRSRRASGIASPTADAMLELVLPDGLRVRLYGEAQRAVLERILDQLSSR